MLLEVNSASLLLTMTFRKSEWDGWVQCGLRGAIVLMCV